MDERTFRLCLIVLLTIALIATIVLGYRFTENGRYRQYNYQQDHVIFGNSMQNREPKAFDTRTGESFHPK